MSRERVGIHTTRRALRRGLVALAVAAATSLSRPARAQQSSSEGLVEAHRSEAVDAGNRATNALETHASRTLDGALLAMRGRIFDLPGLGRRPPRGAFDRAPRGEGEPLREGHEGHGHRAALGRARGEGAQGPRRPYEMNWLVDVPVAAAVGSIWVFPEMMQRELFTLGRCPCDPSMLNPIDRPVAGFSIPNLGLLGDPALAVLLSVTPAIDILDIALSRQPWWHFVEDGWVYGEALLFAGAGSEIAKILTQRPRPVAYGIDPESPQLSDPYLYQSFYSLAVTAATAGLMAGAMTYAYRHPTSPLRYVYFSVGGALAVGMGLGRVLAGRHFPTDVIAGAAVGALAGLVVPALHARRVPVRLTGAPIAGGALFVATITAL